MSADLTKAQLDAIRADPEWQRLRKALRAIRGQTAEADRRRWLASERMHVVETKHRGGLGALSTWQVLSRIDALQRVQKTSASARSSEWEEASALLAPLFQEMGRRQEQNQDEGPLGIPYAPVSVSSEGVHRVCPACGARIAEKADHDGELTTNNYGVHYEGAHWDGPERARSGT